MRAAVALVLLTASVAAAHHRQSPPVIALTTGGDAALPRLTAPGDKTLALARPAGAAHDVVGIAPFRVQDRERLVFTGGDNDHVSVSSRGTTFAWDSDADPLASGAPGRQVLLSTKGVLTQVAVDPSGTSVNPALDPRTLDVVFESTADLAVTGSSGARQVFLRRAAGGLAQLSRGRGSSRNPVVNSTTGLVAFDSTSDASTGDDTGVAQIWLVPLAGGAATVVTHGAAASSRPALSDDGRVLAFESRAALDGDGTDSGASQIFVYDTRSATFARLTDDVAGCGTPAIRRVKRDWRVAFVCSGQAYFYMLRADRRYHVATDGGDTSAIAPQYGIHFVVLSTTADLVAGGSTAGHRVYVVNLFKRPADAVPGLAVWFPTRGIPPL